MFHFCCSYGNKKTIKSQGAGYGYAVASHGTFYLRGDNYAKSSRPDAIVAGNHDLRFGLLTPKGVLADLAGVIAMKKLKGLSSEGKFNSHKSLLLPNFLDIYLKYLMEVVMRKTAFIVFVVLAVLAATACKNNATGPNDPLILSTPPVNSGGGTVMPGPVYGINELVGIWQATEAEVWSTEDPDVWRDLVAEGGTITLVLEASQTYTVTVTMPGEKASVDTGSWYYHEFWGSPQIDFYPSSIPDPEYGEIPSFYVSLSDNTMSLSTGNTKLLPFDLGWYILNLELTR
jgi:hypothetical protein